MECVWSPYLALRRCVAVHGESGEGDSNGTSITACSIGDKGRPCNVSSDSIAVDCSTNHGITKHKGAVVDDQRHCITVHSATSTSSDGVGKVAPSQHKRV